MSHYRQQLGHQSLEAQDNRLGVYKLSEFEKKMNRQVLENPLSRGGAQMVRGSSIGALNGRQSQTVGGRFDGV